jgi:hypothetical protein
LSYKKRQGIVPTSPSSHLPSVPSAIHEDVSAPLANIHHYCHGLIRRTIITKCIASMLRSGFDYIFTLSLRAEDTVGRISLTILSITRVCIFWCFSYWRHEDGGYTSRHDVAGSYDIYRMALCDVRLASRTSGKGAKGFRLCAFEWLSCYTSRLRP